MNTVPGRSMKALLLLAFGGPRCLDEVEFLLTRLFRVVRLHPNSWNE